MTAGGDWIGRGEDRAADRLDRGDGGHRCHAEGCAREVPPALLMCSRHWNMVPAALRDAVWRCYRRGQEADKNPSAAYLAAASAAIRAVAAAERRQLGLPL